MGLLAPVLYRFAITILTRPTLQDFPQSFHRLMLVCSLDPPVEMVLVLNELDQLRNLLVSHEARKMGDGTVTSNQPAL